MRTLLIALLTGAVGAVLAFLGGEITTKAHHVSNMEGGRAMGVVFLITPAGILVGLLVGALTAKLVPGPGLPALARAQGLAWVVTAALAGIVFGYAWMRAPRAPMLDGQYIRLEFEVRMPAGRTAPDSAQEFTVLFTSRGYGDDRNNATLRLDSVTTSEGRVVIPAGAFVYTTTQNRSLVVNDVNEDHFWFDLPLRAKPGKADMEWTEWWPKPGEVASRDIRGNGGFQIRYRVRPGPLPGVN